MQSRFLIFLELLLLLGGVAFFYGQHKAHLDELQDSLDSLQQSVAAANNALNTLQSRREAVACARVETDRELEAAPSGDACYEYYCRVLRGDADRRASAVPASPGGSDGSVR